MTRGPKMWPAVLPAQVREDRYRKAEVKVYDLLRAQLDPRWTVFYSRPWLGLTPTGGEKDGECDFVVVHPDHGYLTIEVKGGGISYDPLRESWVSTDRDGIRHSIKNPVSQARRAKHELLERVKQERGWPSGHYVRARHGVIFPDTENPPGNLGADMPREIFCCRPELPQLDTWVLSRLNGGDEDKLGQRGIQAFERLLAAPFMLRVPLGHVLADDEEQIQTLTPQQFHILDSVSHLPRVAVGGGAGTGKTIVAMEDALRLASNGARTLLTCLSNHLAAHLQLRLRGTAVEVMSFPALCSSVAQRAGLVAPFASFSPDRSPEFLFDAACRDPAFRFDAIIVDEAQDFRTNWWIALEGLLRDAANSRLHAFYDTNQRVYGELTGQLASFSLVPIRLSRNLRNTRMIHKVASNFYAGLPVTADGPEGVSVQWLPCKDTEITATITKLVQTMCTRDKILPGEIAVLVADEPALVQLKAHLLKETDLGLEVVSIHSFKGLERKVVVIAATRALADETELAYVALSRARVHLAVAGDPTVLSWLREA